MLSKLLSVLLAGKGGAVAAAALVAGATSVSVMTTTPEVGDGLRDAIETLSQVVSPGMSEIAKDLRFGDDCEHGKPVVVAQRNAADKMLRDAFQDEHKRLEHLRGGKDTDHEKANAIVQKADRELRGVLTKALNDVARETLGREGLVKVAESTAPVATATATATPTPTPTPTVSPAETTTPVATATATAKPSCSPKPSASPSAVTLNAKLQGIVDAAKAEMKKIVDTAADGIGKLPAAEHGKSAEKGKPESDEHGKPAETERDHGKPSERPGAHPSAAPARP